MSDDLRDVEGLLEQAREMVETARPVPLSGGSVMVHPADLLELLDEAVAALPDELSRARRVVKERDEVLDRAERDSSRVLTEAQDEAERLVSQQEIVRKAARTAQQLLDDARDAAREKILQAEDYIDQKLSQFDAALNKTLDTVHVARRVLQAGPEETAGDVEDESMDASGAPRQFDALEEDDKSLFDQDAF